MKRRNAIDIIARFQTEHALQEEHERKTLHPSPNEAVISGGPDKKGIRQKAVFENEQVRISIMSVPKGTDWSPPHDGRDRVSRVAGQNKSDSADN